MVRVILGDWHDSRLFTALNCLAFLFDCPELLVQRESRENWKPAQNWRLDPTACFALASLALSFECVIHREAVNSLAWFWSRSPQTHALILLQTTNVSCSPSAVFTSQKQYTSIINTNPGNKDLLRLGSCYCCCCLAASQDHKIPVLYSAQIIPRLEMIPKLDPMIPNQPRSQMSPSRCESGASSPPACDWKSKRLRRRQIPDVDRKWIQMIPPEDEEWHGVWFPVFVLFLHLFIFIN